ncbi:hypothetical protein Cgig2_017628 [Carnegiea gigantea]|uniref:Uncharacterized protein n=1 Tax=Carnegiea gigantea TaxID=171969 RepID=A0A9Q1Q4T8_9CARY|nr:hypothetical protein Cgig2_017628 [Carnegiea gigantea]
MPRRGKGFALSLGGSSSSMEPDSSDGSSSGQSIVPTQLTQVQGSRQEGQYTWASELTKEDKEGWLKMIKEGKVATPFVLFVRSHSKEDAESRKVFIDDKSKALWEKYEVLRVERSIEEGTQGVEKLYYEVSGRWSKKFTIYGLSTSATMFYEKPTASTTSIGSTYIPSAYSKLQANLRSTQ